MQIYVFKNNQKTGPFTLDQVQANLKGGIFNSADLCWYEGIPNWNPISTLPDCAPVPGGNATGHAADCRSAASGGCHRASSPSTGGC